MERLRLHVLRRQGDLGVGELSLVGEASGNMLGEGVVAAAIVADVADDGTRAAEGGHGLVQDGVEDGAIVGALPVKPATLRQFR